VRLSLSPSLSRFLSPESPHRRIQQESRAEPVLLRITTTTLVFISFSSHHQQQQTRKEKKRKKKRKNAAFPSPHFEL
jgi:hypothetical protein